MSRAFFLVRHEGEKPCAQAWTLLRKIRVGVDLATGLQLFTV